MNFGFKSIIFITQQRVVILLVICITLSSFTYDSVYSPEKERIKLLNVEHFTTPFPFCSSKTLDEMEVLIEKGIIRRKTIYHFFFMFDNSACSHEKRLQISNLLYKVICTNAQDFLSIYNLCSPKIKERIMVEMKNPISKQSNLQGAIGALKEVTNNTVNSEKIELLKAMKKGIENLATETGIE